MNENRNTNNSGTESSRPMPAAGGRPVSNSGAGSRQTPSPGTTRQIPVKKTGAAPGDASAASSTRQIPAQRAGTAPAYASAASSTRQIPAQRAGNAPTDAPAASSTRQIPVKRAGAAPTDTPAASSTRQIPAQRAGAAPTDIPAASSTRQIPAQRAGAAPGDAPAASSTRQIPAQKSGTAPTFGDTAAAGAANTGGTVATTRQIPVQGAAADNTATRPISTADVTSDGEPSSKGTDRSTDTTSDKGGGKKKSSSAGEDGKKKGRGSGGVAVASVIKAVIYIVAVLVVSIGASVAIILVGNDMYAFVKSDVPVEITIPEGADINDVADILSAGGIINYPSIFKWYAASNNDDGKFVAGTYTVSPATDYEDLLAAFKEQIPEGTTWVTIPEGYTTDEIIDLMVSKGIGTKEGYIDAINNYPYDYWFVQELDATDWKSTGRIYRLDGYLFPDTYEFYNSSSEKTVIGRLLSRFNVIYGEKYKESADASGMTTDQIITIASMIEKEAGDASDYYLVSSVFNNRLKNPDFPNLESDATVLYAIHHETGARPNTVTPEDLEKDTRYNTYLYEGLPPGPIANPSASAINAALAPENTGYYFFVSYGRETYFSSTKAEHDNYVAMIRNMMAAAENNNNQG